MSFSYDLFRLSISLAFRYYGYGLMGVDDSLRFENILRRYFIGDNFGRRNLPYVVSNGC